MFFFISSAPCRGVNGDVEANFFLREIVPLTLRITSCILRAYGSRPGREPPGVTGGTPLFGRVYGELTFRDPVVERGEARTPGSRFKGGRLRSLGGSSLLEVHCLKGFSLCACGVFTIFYIPYYLLHSCHLPHPSRVDGILDDFRAIS